jgi:heme/copper-type cytochrome/quinol oxidase subunit 3
LLFPRHYFNNIEYTKWPFLIGIWVFFFVYYFLLFLNKYLIAEWYLFFFCLIVFIFNMYYWFLDMIIESVFLGRYNRKIRSSIVFGFFLFLVSEIMLFSGFFWTFFDRLFHLNAYTFGVSTFNGLERIQWYNVPLIATIILLSSGYLVNVSYYYLRYGSFHSYLYLVLSILLAFMFLVLQLLEYTELHFTISDSVYSSVFYLLTGFHGVHVLVGTFFLCVSLDRLSDLEYNSNRHLFFGLSIIYWHFVDIIWIFLFIFVYFLSHANSKLYSIHVL